LHLDKVPVGPGLLQRLQAYCPESGRQLKQLQGTCSFDVMLQYRSSSPTPWSHDLRLQLTNGKFSHPRLPMPLERLEAAVHCYDDHVQLEMLTAQAGTAQLSLTGSAQGLGADADLKGTLRISNCIVTEELLKQLPENLKSVNDDFSPRGPINATLAFSRVN